MDAEPHCTRPGNRDVTTPSAPTSSPSITATTLPRLQLAIQQARRPIIESVTITGAARALDAPQLRIACDPAFAHERIVEVGSLGPGEARTLSATEVTLDASTAFLVSATERVEGAVRFELLENGAVVASYTAPITILPHDYWPGAQRSADLLAAFVTPNAPGTSQWLEHARSVLQRMRVEDAFDGYQSEKPERAVELAAAIYGAVAAAGIGYISPPASFEKTGQRVRMADRIFSDGTATCLDLSLGMAAAIEQAGLDPVIVLVDGHAFPGVWTRKEHPLTTVTRQGAEVRNRIRLGELVVFDSSPACSGTPFRAASAATEPMLRDGSFMAMVDVRACRNYGIHPLSHAIDGDTAVPRRVAKGPVASDTSLPALPVRATWTMESIRDEGRDTRVKRWMSALLDLSFNNRLLDLKDSKTVLPLASRAVGALEDALHTRSSLLLQPRPDLSAAAAGTPEARSEATEAFAERALESGTLVVDATQRDFESRALKTYREARAADMESGHVPLYLCLGIVRWFESPSSDVERRSPALLVPVTMERDSVKGPFRIKAQQDETVLNPTLLRRLEQDFGLKTAGLEELPSDENGVDVVLALQNLRAALASQHRFEVLDEAAVALLRFERVLLFNDLKNNLDAFLRNPVVARLIDVDAPTLPEVSPLVKPSEVESKYHPSEDLCVELADSSQLAAVYSAIDGNSLVLQGPPGTGKSQTITNLISNALGRGKTVLFVAEKRAALDVVRDRLEGAGLGPFVLDAHADQRDGKASVIRQFGEAIAYDWHEPDDGWDRHAETIAATRAELDAHVRRVHTKGPFGESLFEAMGRALELGDGPEFPFEGTAEPGTESFEAMRGAAASVVRTVGAVRPVRENPLRGTRPPAWSPGVEREIGEAVRGAMGALDTFKTRWTAVAPELGLDADAADSARWASLLGRVIEGPPFTHALLTRSPAELKASWARVRDLLDARRAASERTETALAPSIYSDPQLGGYLARVRRWAWTFALLAWFMLWGTRRALRRHAGDGALPPSRDLEAPLEAAAQVAAIDNEIASLDGEMRQSFGAAWSGPRTDPGAVESLREAALDVRRALVDVSAADAVRQTFIAWIVDREVALGASTGRGERVRDLVLANADVRARIERVQALLRPEPGALPGGHIELRDRLARMETGLTGLRDWTAYCDARDQACALGMTALVEAIESGAIREAEVDAAVQRTVRRRWIDHRFDTEPELARFRGGAHEAVIQRFREAEAESLSLARRHVQAKCAAKLPDRHAPGPMQVIRNQIRRQRGHMPVRRLFSELRDIVQRLKPCVLMSPLSVARYLDPRMPPFDLVVFDEASQIPPWDAIGALARAKQAVVVGDSKQLPPTAFFQRQSSEEDEDSIQDLESILDHCIVAGFREQTLECHYRSKHESLIAFSNERYYDQRLLIYPSPVRDLETLGLRRVDVPDGSYDRGGSRTNRREAERLVEDLARHVCAPDHASRSIGVVTFSMAQRDLIENLIDERRQRDPAFDVQLSTRSEDVFVKNLESVQGDERDVIYFSIGYGPDPTGKVAMNFGPLNKDGGQRRLNVAVTRSKEQMIVFSSLRPEQIDLSRTGAEGVQDLKLFLDYAERGRRALEEAAIVGHSARHESPFERQVADAVRSRGWDVHAQVGVAGYRVDLAVVRPDAPGSYLVGIECDGAQYHRTASARDRDRLRQMVLERLGWTIHRVWSTDWWLDPSAELEKIDALLRERVSKSAIQEKAPPKAPEPTKKQEVPLLPERIAEDEEPAPQDIWGAPASAWAGLPEVDGGSSERFYEPIASRQIQQAIRTVLGTAAPVSSTHLVRHISRAWGFSSLGSRISERIEREVAESGGKAVDGVAWRSDQNPEGWTGFRYSTGENVERRTIDEIPERELDNAMVAVVERSISLDREEAVRACYQIFGFSRAGAQIQSAMRTTIERVTRQKRVSFDPQTQKLRRAD